MIYVYVYMMMYVYMCIHTMMYVYVCISLYTLTNIRNVVYQHSHKRIMGKGLTKP